MKKNAVHQAYLRKFFIRFQFIVGNAVTDFNISLTPANIVRGLSISEFIGFIPGLMPARTDARLNPVEAMDSV